jgi:hypothetical protein
MIQYFINSFQFLKESEFLHNVLTRQWTLSTSQTPHTQQTEVPDPNHPTFNDKLCPGGGFGNHFEELKNTFI